MILRELSKGFEEEKNAVKKVHLRDLKAFLKGAESVWSIEIALALRAFGAKRVHFYTTEIGAKRQYKNERFYEKTSVRTSVVGKRFCTNNGCTNTLPE